jgi:hypothetical protein
MSITFSVERAEQDLRVLIAHLNLGEAGPGRAPRSAVELLTEMR